MASRNIQSISPSAGRRTTTAQNRVIAISQVLFFITGIILILVGSIRISLESDEVFSAYMSPIVKYAIIEDPDNPVIRAAFSLLSPSDKENIDTNTEETDDVETTSSGSGSALGIIDSFTSIPFLIASFLIAIIGYGLIWSGVALGAKEPPAWHAGRNGLIALIVGTLGCSAAIIWLYRSLFAYIAVPAIFIIVLAGWLLAQFSQADYRLALGAERLQRNENRNFALIRNGILVISISTVIVLGLVHAVLTDAIELPLGDVDPNEFIFMTNFDGYNDEWDQFDDGRLIGVIEADENGDNRLVLTKTPEEDVGFPFTLLDRKLRNFDVRVTITQLESAPDYDNFVGVIFRYRSENEYYRFGISGDGYYRLDKVEPDPNFPDIVRTTRISEWIPTTDTSASEQPPYPTLIRPGNDNPVDDLSDTMNEIRVVGRDNQFWFYINGEAVPLCLKGNRGNSMWTRDFETGGSGCVEGNVPTFVFEDDDYEQGQIGFFADRTPSSSFDEDGRHYPVSIAFDNVLIVGSPAGVPIENFPSLPPTVVPPSFDIPE